MQMDGFGRFSLAAVMGAALAAGISMTAGAAEPTVVDLTQVGCQFLESEKGVDHMYRPKKAEDCDAINAKSGAKRLAAAGPLELKPGKYIFRVTNKNVPYTLGFWLREHDYSPGNPIHKLSKTSVSGGGLTLGKTRDYEVELKPGKYLFSCPLNPTPDYPLVVKG
ncbi:MAG: hypothetical protein OEU46_05255 [Alphaproteobacteria bacterium]|nr:hypothetical protein [Alphaproteobacteria bacterium]